MIGYKCRCCGEAELAFTNHGANRSLCPCCLEQAKLMQRLDLYPIIKPVSGGSGATDKPLSRSMKSYYKHIECNRIKKRRAHYSKNKHCRCGRVISNNATECKSCVKRNSQISGGAK